MERIDRLLLKQADHHAALAARMVADVRKGSESPPEAFEVEAMLDAALALQAARTALRDALAKQSPYNLPVGDTPRVDRA